ncbi:type I-E CRISPR-associated endoribonuclease Cas2 [Nocardia amamiensis]|uniref:type I-E CRISPR-associated endoribonuclease Cas2 n=1 Tax=Nocardia amamiensis TaxID=404578 RepID=UPI0033FC1A52
MIRTPRNASGCWRCAPHARGGDPLRTDGHAVCIHPANNEQGFTVKTAGQRRRTVTDFDGLQLIRFLPPASHTGYTDAAPHDF